MLRFPVRKGPRDQSAREAQSRQPQGGPALAEYGQSLVPPLQLSPAVNHRSKRPRVKKAAPQHTSPAACACLTAFLLARKAPRRVSLNVAMDYGERRLDNGASSPLIIYAFDVADQIADDF